jgi:hypothetical protein
MKVALFLFEGSLHYINWKGNGGKNILLPK